MVYKNNSLNNTANEDFLVTTATAGADRALSVTNTDNSAAASAAHLQVTVGGSTSTGDPYVNFNIPGGSTYSVGIDNSDSDKLKTTTGASPSAGTTLSELFTAAFTLNVPTLAMANTPSAPGPVHQYIDNGNGSDDTCTVFHSLRAHSGGGDAYYEFGTNTVPRFWCIGQDTSDTYALKINQANNFVTPSSGTNMVKIDLSGNVTIPTGNLTVSNSTISSEYLLDPTLYAITTNVTIPVNADGTYYIASGSDLYGTFYVQLPFAGGGGDRFTITEIHVAAYQYDTAACVSVVTNYAYAGNLVVSKVRIMKDTGLTTTRYLAIDIANRNGGTCDIGIIYVGCNRLTLAPAAPATPTEMTTYGMQQGADGVLSYYSNSATSTLGSFRAAGLVVQYVQATKTATQDCTTIIPLDDTIPQKTEGDEVLTCAITPKSATNLLIIKAHTFGTVGANTVAVMALFQDTTASALSACAPWGSNASEFWGEGKIDYEMVAGTASATTFKLRCGPHTGAAHVYVNGSSGGRVFGGVATTKLEIWEVQV